MYNTGWAKSRRALDCFFIFMAEILGGYWQILDRSGKKIIILSPLGYTWHENTQSWSLPSLNFLRVDLVWLDMYRTSYCFSWILAFTVAKHDTTSTTDAFDFSIFWSFSVKATRNDCKCLNVNIIRSKNFQKNVSEQQLACRWIWSMNLKLGTFEAGPLPGFSSRGAKTWRGATFLKFSIGCM